MAIRSGVRAVLYQVARLLNTISAGKITPDSITITSLLVHIPIAWLIATAHPLKAGALLVVFGLFDALDGELARLQGKASNRGAFLDSVTDRLKEILLYVGATYFFVSQDRAEMAVWATAAIGVAVTVSYVNAVGDVVVNRQKVANHDTNKAFRIGLSYDLRIFLFLLGLVTGNLPLAVIVITVLSLLTIFIRMANVIKKLGRA